MSPDRILGLNDGLAVLEGVVLELVIGLSHFGLCKLPFLVTYLTSVDARAVGTCLLGVSVRVLRCVTNA